MKTGLITVRNATLAAAAAQVIGLMIAVVNRAPLLAIAALVAVACSLWAFRALPRQESKGKSEESQPRKKVEAPPIDQPSAMVESGSSLDAEKGRRIQDLLFPSVEGGLATGQDLQPLLDQSDALLPKSGAPQLLTDPSLVQPAAAVQSPTAVSEQTAPALARPAATAAGKAPSTGELDGRRLARECVQIFEEMEKISEGASGPQREVANQITHELRDALERCGIEVIAKDQVFDLARHKAIDWPGSSAPPPGTSIAKIISPGFAFDRDVIRRAIVRLV